jgi:hypothetical protein
MDKKERKRKTKEKQDWNKSTIDECYVMMCNEKPIIVILMVDYYKNKKPKIFNMPIFFCKKHSKTYKKDNTIRKILINKYIKLNLNKIEPKELYYKYDF